MIKWSVLLTLSIVLSSCQTREATAPLYEVIYVDISESCGWNLQLTDEVVIWNYNRSRRDAFLHSDIHRFNTDGHLQFGDTLRLEIEVLEIPSGDYETPDWICNRFQGIPVRVVQLWE